MWHQINACPRRQDFNRRPVTGLAPTEAVGAWRTGRSEGIVAEWPSTGESYMDNISLLALRVRIASCARKHGLSRTRILQALNTHVVATTLDAGSTDPKIRFVGRDGRGVELEVIAEVLPGLLLVVHAMPTRYRRSSP